ncbi:MAG TPA: SRPBCC family protein [Solirubrobacteraceae bacterium]|nr:SRPBCC family protein [Solirubrobacteraceae bacterium]
MPGGDQTITISARARVQVDGAVAFAFLAEPRNHGRLQVPGIRLLTLDDARTGSRRLGRTGVPDDVRHGVLAGGVFALDGPVGMRRIARTTVTFCQPPHRLAGSAWLDSGSEAHVSWTLHPSAADAVTVELTALLGPIARVDRLALALGGRRWIRDRFARTLRRLANELEHAAATASSAPRASAPRASAPRAPCVSASARSPASAPGPGSRVTTQHA